MGDNPSGFEDDTYNQGTCIGGLAWHNRDKNRDIIYREYSVEAPILTIPSDKASSAVEIMQVAQARGDQ